MTEDNEQYAYFTITGDFDPADISDRIGVEASESWRKGDLHTKNRMERKFSRWSLFSRLSKSSSLEDQIRDILAQMDEHEEGFLGVRKLGNSTLQLVGYWYDQYPGLYFEPDITTGVGKYQLAMDFDFYHMYSDSREDT